MVEYESKDVKRLKRLHHRKTKKGGEILSGSTTRKYFETQYLH